MQLAASAGLFLDPWQVDVVTDFLGEREDGKWSALECCLIVPRQNGKSRVLESIALHSLFIDPDAKLTLWSAHQFKTAREAFRNLQAMVTNYDHLRKLVKNVRSSHGEEGIELLDGSRLNFVARSRTSGRGFSGDKLILDEAQEVDPEDIASSLPMLSARPNPQIIYAGTVNPTADHLRRLRDRGELGEETRLAVIEYGAEPDDNIDDQLVWAKANPAFGSRVDPEFIAMERKSYEEDSFKQERLGIWPIAASAVTVFDDGAWERCADPDSVLPGNFIFAVDAPPDRSEAFVAVAGADNGIVHVNIQEAKRGLGWVSEYLIERCSKYSVAVVIDPKSAVGSLIPGLEKAGVNVVSMSVSDVVTACGQFYDAVIEDRIRHLDDPILNLAVHGSAKRQLGDAWAWNRKIATVNISPLVAATNAVWGTSLSTSSQPTVYFL